MDAGADGGSAQLSAEARQRAEEIFSTNCATCHGPEGRGDGPGAAALAVQPRDFHDPEWQTSVSDEHIEQVIVYGGAAVGLSPAMAANPQLSSKPEVVAALREKVRSFGSEGAAGAEGAVSGGSAAGASGSEAAGESAAGGR